MTKSSAILEPQGAKEIGCRSFFKSFTGFFLGIGVTSASFLFVCLYFCFDSLSTGILWFTGNHSLCKTGCISDFELWLAMLFSYGAFFYNESWGDRNNNDSKQRRKGRRTLNVRCIGYDWNVIMKCNNVTLNWLRRCRTHRKASQIEAWDRDVMLRIKTTGRFVYRCYYCRSFYKKTCRLPMSILKMFMPHRSIRSPALLNPNHIAVKLQCLDPSWS